MKKPIKPTPCRVYKIKYLSTWPSRRLPQQTADFIHLLKNFYSNGAEVSEQELFDTITREHVRAASLPHSVEHVTRVFQRLRKELVEVGAIEVKENYEPR